MSMIPTVTDCALLRPSVGTILGRLHNFADKNDGTVIQAIIASGYDWKIASTEENSTTFQDALLPISQDAGKFLYNIARSIGAKSIVEFGTSYGVSTIYLAAALHDNGGGLVIGSELEPSKVAKATQHIADAGLSKFVELRAGDALQTLRDIDATIDLLFLDGWMNLYWDILNLLNHQLRAGSVIVADNLVIAPEQLSTYLDYVRNPENGFISTTLPIDDGIEYSVKF
jgi:predicted O-methyltransferase YrrM